MNSLCKAETEIENQLKHLVAVCQMIVAGRWRRVRALSCCDTRSQRTCYYVVSQQSWLPTSNPIDCRIWIHVEACYKKAVKNMDELEQRVSKTWPGIQHSTTDQAIYQWQEYK